MTSFCSFGCGARVAIYSAVAALGVAAAPRLAEAQAAPAPSSPPATAATAPAPQPAAPQPASAPPPGYSPAPRASPPPQYPPPYYPPSRAEFPPEDESTYEDRREKETRLVSPGKLAGGIVLTVLGPVGIVGGAALALSSFSLFGGGDDEAVLGGFGLSILGSVCLGIGIPLIVSGSKRVTVSKVGSVLVEPTVHLSPTGATFRASF